MAVLTAAQLSVLRETYRNGSNSPIDFTKAQFNAAAQAAEDWFEANKASIATAMGTAATSAGHTFTTPQIKLIATAWLKYKFGIGVL